MEHTKNKNISPVVILVMMLASMISGAMCLNKISPIASIIMEKMQLSGAAQTGVLISVFVVFGIFLAIPIGMIMQKIGMYKMGIIALCAIMMGSIIGAMTMNYPVMLFSRIIEGIGLIILTTVGPAAVTATFDKKKLGSAMGILMCFMTIGQIIMLNFAPRIALLTNWKNVWWLTAIYAVLLLIIWIFLLKDLDKMITPKAGPSNRKINLFPKNVFGNKSVWLVGITFMLYLIAQQGVIAFLPTYLTDVRGISTTLAGTLTSLASFTGLFIAVITGAVSDKMNSRKKPIVFLMIMAAIVYIIMPLFPTNLYGIIIILYGMAVMGIVGLCISAASELVNPEYAGMAVAFMNTMQWIGIFLSSTIFGILVDAFSWQTAFWFMVPLTIIGAVCTAVAKEIK